MVKIQNSPIDWVRCYRLESKNKINPDSHKDNMEKLADRIHPDVFKGRFWVDGVGICYVANREETAIIEATNAVGKFYKIHKREPQGVSFTLLEIAVDTSALYCDIRGLQEQHPELYDRDDYSKSQAFAKKQHSNGEKGIIYDSVRHAGGECAAVFTEENLKSDTIKDIALYWGGEDFSTKE